MALRSQHSPLVSYEVGGIADSGTPHNYHVDQCLQRVSGKTKIRVRKCVPEWDQKSFISVG